MGAHLSSLFTQLLVCFAGLLICVLTQLQAQAGGGDIIISREVQPRAATRQALVPDPNALVANPNHSARIRHAVGAGGMSTEVSDGEFAGVTTGVHLGSGVQVFTPAGDTAGGAPMHGHDGQGVASRAGGTGGLGATGRIGSTVNRSVQQGLRPLQNLGK